MPRPLARRRTPRRRDPEAKRAMLMASARELFSERGYAATTTADVARHAGVSEGMVFHHFGSKSELLEAVAADYGRGLGQAMDAAWRESPTVESGLRAAFTYVRERGALARLLRFAHEPSDTAAAKRASRAQIIASIERGLAALAGTGLLRPLDTHITAELLYALVESALMECFLHGDGTRESDYLRETVACVEGAVVARSRNVPNPRSTQK